MDYKAKYTRWLEKVDEAGLKAELEQIKNDDNEQKSRFENSLTFGTAGLRGIIGAGTDRMNIYTVGRATQGLADYINECFGGGTVAISYDSRNRSTVFAHRTAEVLAANGIGVYIYDRLMPTPMLSFAVRETGSKAGVMITASHNPAEYNGYKVYGDDGCQMTTTSANAVYLRIEKTDDFDDVKTSDFYEEMSEGRIKYVDKRVIEKYYDKVKEQSVNPGICEKYPISVVYSPLNGTGNEPVRRILADIGVKTVYIVGAQELPDGDFPTCSYPNPETREALMLGLELSEIKKPDLFVATDPDADRVGVAFPNAEGKYTILSGNEIGVLMLDYICRSRTANGTMPKSPVAVESIVSTALARDVANGYGVEMITVLTGFKYIGEQILLLEHKGEQQRFIFGFEESCGYLAGSYVRDKDAVFAAMTLAEMCSYYKSKETTPIEVLEEIYKTYGYYRSKVVSFEFAGLDGKDKMAQVMEKLYENAPKSLAGFDVTCISDFKRCVRRSLLMGTETQIELPSADVIEFTLENGATVMVRPSGTEPKMKLYLSAKESSAAESDELLGKLLGATKKLLGL